MKLPHDDTNFGIGTLVLLLLVREFVLSYASVFLTERANRS
jgi:hypothetical protein